MHTQLSLLALTAAAAVLATPAPQPTANVYRMHVDRSHLVSRSSSRTFNAAAVQRDLDKVIQRAHRVQTCYTQFVANNSLHEKKSAVPYKRDPFDIATLRKRHNKRAGSSASYGLEDDVVYGQDNAYYGNVSFGTPSQVLTIDFDTGSADLWVPDSAAVSTASSSSSSNHNPFSNQGGLPIGGNNSTNPGSTSPHTAFHSSNSSTFTSSGTAFSITYGSGDASGTLGTDLVAMGSMSVSKQVFAVVSQLSSSFAATPFDGLMGLGFSTIAQSGAPTFFENLVANGNLASNVFSFALGRGSASSSVNVNSETQVRSGSMIFGGVDSGAYSGSLAYQDVTTKGYWETQMGGIEVAGTVVNGSANAYVAWDTGTSLAYFPTTIAAAIASALGAQEDTQASSSSSGTLYVLKCSKFSNGLQVAISFGGQSFAWNDYDLNGGTVDSSGQYCALNIIGADTQDPVGNEIAIIGDAFLKNVVAVFDYSGSRVGMASSSGSSSTSTSTSSSTGSKSGASSIYFSPVLCALAFTTLFFFSR